LFIRNFHSAVGAGDAGDAAAFSASTRKVFWENLSKFWAKFWLKMRFGQNQELCIPKNTRSPTAMNFLQN